MPKKGMTMRMIADQIAAIRIEDRYFDLCSWELYQLTPNEKKSKATQYKIHFMPYKNRICENLLKRYLTDDSIEFELDKMHKIDEGVYKGEELENYEKCHIVLLLLINKDILNKLRISDLVRRIARFIARTPSYIERCLSNFSKWFVPSDYGIMDDQQEEGDEDEDEDEEEEEDKENKRLLEGEGRNRSETPQRTQSNNVGTNQTSARIMLSAFRKWNTSIILPIKDKFCIEVVGKHPEIEEAKHQIDYLEQERKTKRGLVAERLNMVNKCKGI